MKVLHIIPTLGVGGAESFVVDLSLEQHKMKVNVSILTLFGVRGVKGGALISKLDGRVSVIDASCRNKIFSVLFALLKILSIRDYFIHVHLEPSEKFIYIYYIIGLIQRNKFFLTIHNSKFNNSRVIFFLRNLIYSKIIFCNKYSYEKYMLSNNYIFNYSYVNNGVSSVEFCLPKSKNDIYKFICIAGFRGESLDESQKNQKFLIQTISHLNIDNVELLLIGDGPTKNQAVELSKSFNSENKIKFLGNLDNPFAYFDDKSFLVISSRYEGLPIVLLEAVARNIRVISCDLPEILSLNIDGVLFYKNNNPSSFIALVEEIIKSSMKSNFIYQSIQSYSMSNCALNYQNCYLNIK